MLVCGSPHLLPLVTRYRFYDDRIVINLIIGEVVAHTFNPSTGEAETELELCEFKDSLVYRGSSRTKIHRESISKSQKLKVKIKKNTG